MTLGRAPESAPTDTVAHPTGGQGGPTAAQGGPDFDPVELALATALEQAAQAQQWQTVEVLSRELTARREARAAVVSLDAERARRGAR